MPVELVAEMIRRLFNFQKTSNNIVWKDIILMRKKYV